MAKNTRGHKELDKLQTAHREIDKLKRENAKLRKQFARLDLDRHDYVQKIVQEHLHQEEEISGDEILASLKRKWACHEPGCAGHLEIFLYSKMGEPWFWRQCSQCPNRTKSQKYDATQVRGIIKESPPPDPRKSRK